MIILHNTVSFRNTSRVVLDVLIVIAILQGWWFVALPLVMIGTWSYVWFVESVVAGLAFDALYGMADLGVRGYLGIIVSVGVVVLLKIIRTLIRK